MITPQELREKEFSRVIRGYSVAEVDAYFEELKEAFTDLYIKNAELEKQIIALTAQNKELVSSKPTPKHIIGEARENADKIISDANDEAAIIIASAKTSCDNLLNEFRFRLGAERDKLVELQTAVRNFKTAIYSAYQEHIDSVESIVDEADFDSLDMEAQEYSTKVVSDIKTEVAYLMAELNQKREREESPKIEDEYFENRDEILAQELSEEETPAEVSDDTAVPAAAENTVVFDPDIDLSDLPEEMDENPSEPEEIEAIDISFEENEASEEIISDEPEQDATEPEPQQNYDDLLEKFAEELKAENESDNSNE